MTRAVLSVALLVTLGGCASSQFQAQADAADRQVDLADDAGASDRELKALRRELASASREERRAVEEQKSASKAREAAKRDLARAEARVGERQAELDRTVADATVAAQELAPALAERQALLERGLVAREADRLVGPRLPFLRERVTSLAASQRAREARLELARLELEGARARAALAETDSRIAEQRLQSAGLVYDMTHARARTLELEQLAATHTDVQERLHRATP